jgi:hypothetical protein
MDIDVYVFQKTLDKSGKHVDWLIDNADERSAYSVEITEDMPEELRAGLEVAGYDIGDWVMLIVQ